MPTVPPGPDAASRDAMPAGGEPVALARWFAELADDGWPVALLARRLPDLLRHAPWLAPQQRGAWLGGLHAAWRQAGPALADDSRLALLELAAAWQAWPLVGSVGATLERARRLPSSAAPHVIEAHRRLGDGEAAVALAVRLQLSEPHDPAHAARHARLRHWLRWRDARPMLDTARWGTAELVLEPLGHHHLTDFAWQYHDPAIARLCCLPRFESNTHWHDWLEDGLRGGKSVFAVLHREWGFIGCASLILHGPVGFFYYWLGRDFQGRGLGPRAVARLLDMARTQQGMRTCYAKVFDYNAPSRSALAKLGFEPLGIAGMAPHGDQLFYRRGERCAPHAVAHELHALLDHIGSDVKAAAPLRAA
ncbi:GNAT family N-acetyltransferase [Burkholderia plantarii]|uniref:GNAT family N-acetyltransferase n=1 Tax=Burkholderia plantarii TaxID=41899 RepID=UPI0018DB9867|nr:GNAT family N-acetyltransferase [Burkholderia plantarii]MBI0329765.1 GNAT family N-acetyltransferase [Burkholderia plantarii]